MTAFSYDPQKQLGNMSQGITGLPIVIGLPSGADHVPHFVVGVSTEERANTSTTLPGLQLSQGDLFLKSARNPGSFSFKIIFSETQNIKNQKIADITKALQQLSTIASGIYAFGGVLPTISGISSNFAVSQLVQLQAMKDGAQPILALNLFMPLNTFSSRNPFLTSAWFIEHLEHDKGASERGVVVDVTLKELLIKREIGSRANIITSLANSIIGPAVGSSIASL